MSGIQSVKEFDELFFSNIKVPSTKDYSRLSNSPSRYVDCDSSYFKKFQSEMDCDTPVKMKLPKMIEQGEVDGITNTNENFFPSLSSSGSTSLENAASMPTSDAEVKQISRAPLKIVPVETQNTDENQLIEGLSKLSMFNAQEPEERISQKRRSELKKKKEEENSRRSQLKPSSETLASKNRSRSISINRTQSKDQSISRIPLGQRSRANSTTRDPNTNSSDNGVVTRSMAKAAASVSNPALSKQSSTKVSNAPVSTLRKTNMPLKIAPKTPIITASDTNTNARSRDRTRRTNTTGQSLRSSIMNPPEVSKTPVVPPRRANSLTRTTPGPIATKGRPIATANRTSMLRANAVKQKTANEPKVAATSRQLTNTGVGTRARVNTVPESVVAKSAPKAAIIRTTPKPAQVPVSATRPARQPIRITSSAVRSSSAAGRPVVTASHQNSKPLSRQDTNALFSRLSTPKSMTTPVRPADNKEGLRKSTVRPVPTYIKSATKNGLPSGGGLHGLRAPSKERTFKASTESLQSTSQKLKSGGIVSN